MNPYSPPNQPYGVPPPQGYAPTGPTQEDASHLNTLAICHFVYGGFLAFLGLIGLVYVGVGVLVAANMSVPSAHGTSPGPPAAAIGGLIAVIGGAIMLFVWAKAAFVIYSGMCLKRRQKRVLSMVAACLCCIYFPLGTVLGAFTLVVLSRASVKALYERVAYYGA
jgi:hypothetical protein